MGIGLRSPHIGQILAGCPDAGWLEILADNYLAEGGRCRRDLERVRANHACTFHCVGMSIGSADALNYEYLDKIKALADCCEPAWISDHLCHVSARGEYQHDLLPLPYTEEAVRHVAGRIVQIQERLQRRILIENVSCYLDFKHSAMSEAEFVNAVCEQADCRLLLDVNNLYVNQVNLGTDARDFLETVNVAHVREIHLAGFEQKEGYVIDAHNHPVSNDVWNLYGSFIERNPQIPTLIEWDFDVPDLDTLVGEARKARARYPKPAPARAARTNTGRRTGAVARGNGHGPKIKTLQGRFLRALKDDDSALQPHVRRLPRLPFATQISIYRNNANNARILALEESHPVCVKILGRRYFRQVAKAFLLAHPSRHPDLNRYGAELASFIAKLTRTREELRDFAYLPDLAQLEYLHHRCYYRKDDVRTDCVRLGQTGATGRQPRVFLNHTVALMSSAFPVFEIWRAHQHPNPQTGFEQPPQPRRICIYREGSRPRIEEIRESDYRILQRAAHAPLLGELIGELESDGHWPGRAISRAIPALVEKNWLVVDADV